MPPPSTAGCLRSTSASVGWSRVSVAGRDHDIGPLSHGRNPCVAQLSGGPGRYTHRGQPIGAGIGPAGNGQFISVDRDTSGGRLGLSFQRIRFDDDAFFSRFTQANAFAFDRNALPQQATQLVFRTRE